MFRLKTYDIKFLKSLSEYRILTIPQITAFHFTSKHVARRRICQLIEEGFVEATGRGFGRRRGRPERIIFLARKGIEFLIKRRILPVSYNGVNSNNLQFSDHQLLVNWFQIHLVYMERVIPPLKIKFIPSGFLFNLRENNGFSIATKEKSPCGIDPNINHFIPDGVFSVTDNSNKQEPKSLLSFLEVDMATESLSSLIRNARDVRQKIINYQEYFRTGKYKWWEPILNCKFNGFRLLFLASTHSRMSTLCRLIQEIPPSNFIWISSQGRMFEKGLTDKIWQKGGKLDDAPESILGSKMACSSPMFPIKD